MKLTTLTATLVAAGALGLGGASMATAKGGNDVVRATGTCSAGVTAKLKAKHDDGLLEVEFEVDQNRNGVRWTWGLARDGRTVRSGVARTKAPSGSFSVERRIADGPGATRVGFRAVSSSGKVCTARLTV